VTKDSWLKILDFGLANPVRPISAEMTTASLNEPRVLAGTLAYMANEQLRGNSIGVQTDIYGLGAVLYEMATGQCPYATSDGPRLGRRDLPPDLSPVSSVNPAIPAAFEAIVMLRK
jgi:serine/threonine protein kinase